MTKKLLIVESSSKCGIIETYLGANYKCISCNGHIRIIKDIKSIDTKHNFETVFSLDPDKKAHVKRMAAIVSQFQKEDVIVATDADREGEAIAWHICEVFDLPIETTNRIVFHEITKTALLKAVQTPRTIDMNLVQAQQARQVLDMLVGFTLSPLLWKYLNNNQLSAGRCQTPALRLVNENEIEAKGKEVLQKHKIVACFFPQNLMFELDKDFDNETLVKEFMAESVNYEHTFKTHAYKLVERTPPKPFNTSALLQAANNFLHLSAKNTMACCQTLYQMGHITYMRTENRKYSPTFIEVATKYIKDKFSEKHANPTLMETHGNNDSANPHEAIRVTNVNMRELVLISDKNTQGIERVYKLIWQNTVQSCMAPAVINTLPLEINAPQTRSYKYTLEIPKFNGFLDLVLNEDKKTFSPELISSMVMRFQTCKSVKYNYIQSTVGFTNRHTRFSEASLIGELEDKGIGRPSTYSMLVDTIQARKYVDKRDIEGTVTKCVEYMLRSGEKDPTETKVNKTYGKEHDRLVIEPVGTATIDFLLTYFENLFSYDYTRQMEDRLDLVAKGDELWYNVCKDCYKEMKTQIKSIDKLEKKIYKLKDNDDFVLMFYKSGYLLKCVSKDLNENKSELYRNVKKDLKLDQTRLDTGDYTFEELAEASNHILGTWHEHSVELKTGKFGPYVEYNDGIRVSLNKLKKPFAEIVLDDVLKYIEKECVLKNLSDDLSIRKGKYGPYIYYKTSKMKKPEFFDLKSYKKTFDKIDGKEMIDWITNTYLEDK
jgi:DNA topoisomerase-1